MIAWVSRNARIAFITFAAASDNVELRVESTLKGSAPGFGMLQEPEVYRISCTALRVDQCLSASFESLRCNLQCALFDAANAVSTAIFLRDTQ